MPNLQESLFPTVEDVTSLWRAIVNDTFPGINGTTGRIATDDAPFTLPFLNNAITSLARKLRNEGVTFPIIDGYVLNAVPPVVEANPAVFISIGFNGTYNGTTTSATPFLPNDCLQVYTVRQRQTGSNLQFVPMPQCQQGLPSAYQNQWMGQWEWRRYAIWMNGSLQTQDLMIRYKQGQPPINVAPELFAETPIYILDSTDALAYLMAESYGRARGADPQEIASCKADAEEAIDEMALEYVRRQQTVNYARPSYEGGGSNADGSTALGSTGTIS